MSPIKLVLNKTIENKCLKCDDEDFCKLKVMYTKIENPDLKQLQHLKQCIYFKKFKKNKNQ